MTVVVKQHDGVDYVELCKTRLASATVAYGDEKQKWQGTMVFEDKSGSWKYGPEFHVVLYTPIAPVVKKERALNNGIWYRIELNVPIDEGKRMIQEASDYFKPPIKMLHEVL